MLSRTTRALFQQQQLLTVRMMVPMQSMMFTGKTESGFKFKTAKLRMKKVRPVPAPGLNLKIPADLTPEKFCRMIGGDCDEIADKFEDDISAVFNESGEELKKRDIPTHQRKYIMSKYTVVLTFI